MQKLVDICENAEFELDFWKSEAWYFNTVEMLLTTTCRLVMIILVANRNKSYRNRKILIVVSAEPEIIFVASIWSEKTAEL